MKALTRTQKITLLVLTVLDFVIICGLGAIIVTSGLRPAQTAPARPSATATNVVNLVPTWTPTATRTPRATLPARLTNTPTPTTTPIPTATPTVTPTPQPPKPVELAGADFNFLLPNRVPGWDWDAYVNYRGGEDYDVHNSYAEPLFSAADDPIRQINGSTLKVETLRWLKFRAWVHQTVTVTAGSTAYFEIKANAFSSLDRLIVKAGIDPTGGENCYNARWGAEQRIDQHSGIVTLQSPVVTVPAIATPEVEEDNDVERGEGTPQAEEQPGAAVGRVTVCFYAEPAFPHVNNAAFFDQAKLTVRPPR